MIKNDFSEYSTQDLKKKILGNSYSASSRQKYKEKLLRKLYDISLEDVADADRIHEYEEKVEKFGQNISGYLRNVSQFEEALGDKVGGVEAQTKLDCIMQKSIGLHQSLTVVLGWAGVGKTHTIALALNKIPPHMRISTPCAESPVRATKHYQVSINKPSEDIVTKSVQSNGKYKELPASQFTKMLLKSGENMTLSEHNNIAARNFKMNSTDKRFIGVMSMGLENIKPLSDVILGQLTDCGGQPQFMEILPRFISNMSLGILVIDLSKRLEDFPLGCYYGKDGKVVGHSFQSNLSNEQMIRMFLQMISSLSKKDRKTRFMIVGTHRDEEHKCAEEPREQKEKKLTEIICSSGLQDHAIYCDHNYNKVIFAVNAKNPDEDDHAIGLKIMKESLSETWANHIDIPLKYFYLELTLKNYTTQQKAVWSFQEVQDIMAQYFVDEDSLVLGLNYLNKSLRILFFPKLNLIFGEPQFLLDMITSVIVRHIMITSNPDQQSPTDGAWKCFKTEGILSTSVLEDIFGATTGPLSTECLLKVMQTLSLTCIVDDKKYLMPCLLLTKTPLPPFSGHSFLLHFHKTFAPFGLFCSTVCKLVSKHQWELSLSHGIYRNNFQFKIPRCPCIVTLSDSFDSFFQVNLEIGQVPPQGKVSICIKVRKTVIAVIKEVIEELHYNTCPPEVAFLCDHPHKDHAIPHAAEYAKDLDLLVCTRESMVVKPLSEEQKLWIEGDIGLPNCYSKCLEKIPPNSNLDEVVDWNHDNTDKDLYDIALLMKEWEASAPDLGLSPGDILDIKNDHHSAIHQRIAALIKWKQLNPFADTYHQLLKVCCKWGNDEAADVICNLVKTDNQLKQKYETKLKEFTSKLQEDLCTYLNKEIDFDDQGHTYADLHEIARAMVQWDVMAPQLDLTHADIDDIKKENHAAPHRQRIAALTRWKELHPHGTYRDILMICLKYDDTATAKSIVKLLEQKHSFETK